MPVQGFPSGIPCRWVQAEILLAAVSRARGFLLLRWEDGPYVLAAAVLFFADGYCPRWGSVGQRGLEFRKVGEGALPRAAHSIHYNMNGGRASLVLLYSMIIMHIF